VRLERVPEERRMQEVVEVFASLVEVGEDRRRQHRGDLENKLVREGLERHLRVFFVCA